jgi:hypothetical protein
VSDYKHTVIPRLWRLLDSGSSTGIIWDSIMECHNPRNFMARQCRKIGCLHINGMVSNRGFCNRSDFIVVATDFFVHLKRTYRTQRDTYSTLLVAVDGAQYLATIINIQNSHWIAVVIDTHKGHIHCGDSLGGNLHGSIHEVLIWYMASKLTWIFPFMLDCDILPATGV